MSSSETGTKYTLPPYRLGAVTARGGVNDHGCGSPSHRGRDRGCPRRRDDISARSTTRATGGEGRPPACCRRAPKDSVNLAKPDERVGRKTNGGDCRVGDIRGAGTTVLDGPVAEPSGNTGFL